jgi:hypothetical protein
MASRTVRDRASDSEGEAQHDAHANRDLGATASRWSTRQDKEDLSVKIKAFDPKEMEWGAFRAYFLALSNQANWSDSTKASRLMCALQGKMVGVVAGLPQPVTIDALLARMDDIYGMSNSEENAILKLQSIRMEPGEQVSMFAERVRQLVARAYPSYPEEDRMKQGLRAFLQGLPIAGNFRMQMKVQGFRTLKEAVEYAVRMEQVLNDEKPRGNPVRMANAGPEESATQLAQELGRFRDTQAQMLQALKDLQIRPPRAAGPSRYGPGPSFPRSCFECGERGHIKRDCPRLEPRQPSN